MSARVSLSVADDGQLLAVKTALDGAEALALHAEAEAISAADHPGVVTLYDLHPGPGGLQLRTGWVGTRSVADLRHIDPARAAALCAGVAETLADLHERGLVHGRIEASHVLLDVGERPVLCSLGQAGPVDQATPEGELRRPSTDVGDLGRLLEGLAALPSPGGASRWGTTARRDAQLRRSLRDIAARASALDPAERPSALALASALRAAAGSPPSPPTPTPIPTPLVAATAPTFGEDPPARPFARLTSRQPGRRREPVRVRWQAVAAGALLLVSTGAAVGAVAAERGASEEPRAAEHGTDLGATDEPRSELPGLDDPAPDRPAAATGSRSEPEPTVVVNGRLYSVGRSGDQAAAADWRCDGGRTVALVRPSTGSIFLFESPLPANGPRTATPVAHVEVGSTLVPPAPGTVCPTLAVMDPTGRYQVVKLPPPTPEPVA